MLKRKLVLSLALLGLTLFFVACDSMLETDNYNKYESNYAVMKYNPNLGKLTMNTKEGSFVVEDDGPYPLKNGDCIYADYFRVYVDKQPTNKYITATNLVKTVLETKALRTETGTVGEADILYNETFNYIRECQTSPNFYGIFFVQGVHKGVKAKEYAYSLVLDPDSVDALGINSFYLRAQLKDTQTDHQDLRQRYSFDLNEYVELYGTDVTSKNSKGEDVNYRVAYFNLKYQTGKTAENKPIYSSLKEPIEIMVYK